jgi:TatD DNase family protein
MAKKFLALGFYISFAGNITHKNGKWEERWKEVIEKIPLDKLLIETDAPYISPYPHDIIYTIKRIAEIKKVSIREIKIQTYLNAINLFHSRFYFDNNK